MRRHLTRLAVAFIATTSFLLLMAVPAHADTPCDTPIYAQSRFIRDTSQVKTAAAQFEAATGASVRVVVVDRHSFPDLDQYKINLIQACTSWGGGTIIRHNLFVLMAYIAENGDAVDTKQTKTLLSFGADYQQALQDSSSVIRKSMSPDIIRGDVSSGIIKGLTESKAAIDRYNARGSGGRPAPQAPATPSQPVDYSGLFAGLWILLVIVLAAAALILLIFFIVSSRKRRSEEKARYNDLRNLTAAQLVKLEEGRSEGLERRINDIKLQVDDNGDEQILALDIQFTEKLSACRQQFDKLEADPVYSWWATSYAIKAAEYNSLLQGIMLTRQDYDHLVKLIKDLEQKITDAESWLEEYEKRYATLQNRINELQSLGYILPDTGRLIEEITQLLQSARGDVDIMMAGQALDELDEVVAKLIEAEEIIEKAPSAQSEFTDLLKQARKQLKESELEVRRATGITARISVRFGPRACDNLPEESSLTDQIASASALLRQAEQQGSMKSQQWSQAVDSLKACEATLTKCSRNAVAVIERQDGLEQLNRSLPSDISQAAESARVAARKASQRKGSQDDYQIALKSLASQLEDLHAGKLSLLDKQERFNALSKEVNATEQQSCNEHEHIVEEARVQERRRIAAEEAERAAERAAERRREDARVAVLYAPSYHHDSTPSYSPPNYGGGDSGGL